MLSECFAQVPCDFSELEFLFCLDFLKKIMTLRFVGRFVGGFVGKFVGRFAGRFVRRFAGEIC
jgi:hypothetical protein